MLANPFSPTVRYRGGIPVLPGAFPVVGHLPSLFDDAVDVLLRGRDTLGPVFWLDHGFGVSAVACVSREGFDVFRSRAASSDFIQEKASTLETAQFGGGPHFCLGYHLAWFESVAFAVALAQRMSKEGLRPTLADGPAPRHHSMPLGHPSKSAKVVFA